VIYSFLQDLQRLDKENHNDHEVADEEDHKLVADIIELKTHASLRPACLMEAYNYLTRSGLLLVCNQLVKLHQDIVGPNPSRGLVKWKHLPLSPLAKAKTKLRAWCQSEATAQQLTNLKSSTRDIHVRFQVRTAKPWLCCRVKD